MEFTSYTLLHTEQLPKMWPSQATIEDVLDGWDQLAYVHLPSGFTRVMGSHHELLNFVTVCGWREVEIMTNGQAAAENYILTEAIEAVADHADAGTTLDVWDAYDAVLEGVRDATTLRGSVR